MRRAPRRPKRPASSRSSRASRKRACGTAGATAAGRHVERRGEQRVALVARAAVRAQVNLPAPQHPAIRRPWPTGSAADPAAGPAHAASLATAATKRAAGLDRNGPQRSRRISALADGRRRRCRRVCRRRLPVPAAHTEGARSVGAAAQQHQAELVATLQRRQQLAVDRAVAADQHHPTASRQGLQSRQRDLDGCGFERSGMRRVLPQPGRQRRHQTGCASARGMRIEQDEGGRHRLCRVVRRDWLACRQAAGTAAAARGLERATQLGRPRWPSG